MNILVGKYALVALAAFSVAAVAFGVSAPRDTSATATPTPSHSQPIPTPAGERTIKTAYLTGYSYWDNTPPGSATIAYPKKDGHPTVHNVAGGTGSYANPVTLAVGWHRKNGPVWPVGSRFYLPFLHKYLMVEDQCGDRAQNGPCYKLGQADAGSTTWLDVWVGGAGQSKSVSDKCMSTITKKHTVIYRPVSTYPVTTGDITSACKAKQFYSETPPGR